MKISELLIASRAAIYAAFARQHGGLPEDRVEWAWGSRLRSLCLEHGLVHTGGTDGALALRIVRLYHHGRELVRPQRPPSAQIILEYGERSPHSMIVEEEDADMCRYLLIGVLRELDLDFHDFPMLREQVAAARDLGWEECSTWMWFEFLQTRAERAAPRPEHRWSDKLQRCGWSNADFEVPEWMEVQADAFATIHPSERGDFEPAMRWLAQWGAAHPLPKKAVLAAMERGRHYASYRASAA